MTRHRPWRVLGLANTYPPEVSGGYAEVSADFMEELAARGHDVRMLVSSRPDLASTASEEARAIAVRRDLDYVLAPWRHPVRGLRATGHDERLVRDAIRRGVDIAIVWHMRGVMKPSLRLLHDAGIPVMYMLHDRWVLYERAGPWLRPWPVIDRLGFAGAREIAGRAFASRLELRAPPIEAQGWNCFVGRWLEDEHRRLGYRPQRRAIVPCGIDLSQFAAEEFQPPLGSPRRLLFAGRIHPWKGLHVAVDALAQAATRFTLRVAGPVDDASYEQAVRDRAAALGVADRIEWLGTVPRSRVRDELAHADVVVYPSITVEAYALGILEALAAHRLVVASAPGGPRDYLVHEGNSLLHEPGDAHALAAELDRLAVEPDLRARIAEGARRTAEMHDLRHVVDEFEALMGEALRCVTGDTRDTRP